MPPWGFSAKRGFLRMVSTTSSTNPRLLIMFSTGPRSHFLPFSCFFAFSSVFRSKWTPRFLQSDDWPFQKVSNFVLKPALKSCSLEQAVPSRPRKGDPPAWRSSVRVNYFFSTAVRGLKHRYSGPVLASGLYGLSFSLISMGITFWGSPGCS